MQLESAGGFVVEQFVLLPRRRFLEVQQSRLFRSTGDTIKQKASLIYGPAVVKKGGRRERMQRCCDERRR